VGAAVSAQQNDRSPDTACLYAWLSRDADGIEGLIAAPVGRTVMPLVTGDEARARRLEPVAAYAARMRGMPALLVKFTRAETLRTVEGA